MLSNEKLTRVLGKMWARKTEVATERNLARELSLTICYKATHCIHGNGCWSTRQKTNSPDFLWSTRQICVGQLARLCWSSRQMPWSTRQNGLVKSPDALVNSPELLLFFYCFRKIMFPCVVFVLFYIMSLNRFVFNYLICMYEINCFTSIVFGCLKQKKN